MTPPYLPPPVVPDGIPTAAELVKLGHAHIRYTEGGRIAYVIHDSGHALLGELLRERGRR